MTTPPITPPVPEDLLADAVRVAENGTNLKADIPVLQRVVKADKSAIVAALVHVAVLLVAAFDLHLTADDVAILGTIVGAGLSWFVTLNLSK